MPPAPPSYLELIKNEDSSSREQPMEPIPSSLTSSHAPLSGASSTEETNQEAAPDTPPRHTVRVTTAEQLQPPTPTQPLQVPRDPPPPTSTESSPAPAPNDPPPPSESLPPPPSPKPKSKVGNNYDPGYRITVLSYMEANFANGDKKAIAEKFGCSLSQIYSWAKIARQRGHQKGEPFTIDHVKDAPRSGRPKIITETSGKLILDTVGKDHSSSSLRELGAASGIRISETSIRRILKDNRSRSGQ